MRKSVLTALLLLLFPALSYAQGKDPVVLRYQYPEGKQLTYKYRNTTELDLGGISARAMIEWQSNEKLARRSGEDTLHVSVVYSDIGESILVSSRLIQQAIFGSMADKPFQFSISPRGALTHFIPPSAQKVDFTQLDLFEFMSANLELSHATLFPHLPEHPVAVGDTWTTKRKHSVPYQNIGSEGSVTVSSTYTVKKAKKNKGHWGFEIEEKNEISTHVFNSFGEISVITDGKGTAKGKFFLDYERGLITKYETSAVLETESIILTGPEQSPVKSRGKSFAKRELKKIK